MRRLLVALVALSTIACAASLPAPAPLPARPAGLPLDVGITFAPFTPEEQLHVTWDPLWRVQRDQFSATTRAILLVVCEDDASVDAAIPYLGRGSAAAYVELGNECNFAHDAASVGAWWQRMIAKLAAVGWPASRVITGGLGNIDADTLGWWLTASAGLPPDAIAGWHCYSNCLAQIPQWVTVLHGRRHAMTEWGYPEVDEAQVAARAASDLQAIRASGSLTAIWYQLHDAPHGQPLNNWGLHALDGHWRAVEQSLIHAQH